MYPQLNATIWEAQLARFKFVDSVSQTLSFLLYIIENLVPTVVVKGLCRAHQQPKVKRPRQNGEAFFLISSSFIQLLIYIYYHSLENSHFNVFYFF